MKKRKPFVIIIYIVILALAFGLILSLFNWGDDLTYSEVTTLLRDGKVKSFVVKDTSITLELYEKYNGKTKLTGDIADQAAFRQEMAAVIQEQQKAGTLKSFHYQEGRDPSAFDLILPLLIVGLVLLLIWAFLAGRANGVNPMASFGKARTVLGVPDGKKVTFADVAGADEEKEELQEVVDFLRDPE